MGSMTADASEVLAATGLRILRTEEMARISFPADRVSFGCALIPSICATACTFLSIVWWFAPKPAQCVAIGCVALFVVVAVLLAARRVWFPFVVCVDFRSGAVSIPMHGLFSAYGGEFASQDIAALKVGVISMPSGAPVSNSEGVLIRSMGFWLGKPRSVRVSPDHIGERVPGAVFLELSRLKADQARAIIRWFCQEVLPPEAERPDLESLDRVAA
jgi:hypothetical protein